MTNQQRRSSSIDRPARAPHGNRFTIGIAATKAAATFMDAFTKETGITFSSQRTHR